jgi:hypothetical protein
MNEKIIIKRKRRSDRMHLIYVVTNVVTDEKYVGIAACIDRSGKETLAARWSRHVGRAFNQGKSWALCESIRTYGPEAFAPVIFDFVRGKAAAHAAETELRKTGQFKLNTV